MPSWSTASGQKRVFCGYGTYDATTDIMTVTAYEPEPEPVSRDRERSRDYERLVDVDGGRVHVPVRRELRRLGVRLYRLYESPCRGGRGKRGRRKARRRGVPLARRDARHHARAVVSPVTVFCRHKNITRFEAKRTRVRRV